MRIRPLLGWLSKGLHPRVAATWVVYPWVGMGQGRVWGGGGMEGGQALGGWTGLLEQGRDLACRQAWGCGQRRCPASRGPIVPRRAPPRVAC